jgi:tetratricopeptide (TPR) repeat protein
VVLLGASCFAQQSPKMDSGHASMPASTAESAQFQDVHFPISCSAAAQEQFDRGVSMLHSFFYPETVNAFTKVAEIDPSCLMAYWGIAISQRPNPLVPPFDSANLKRGYEAIQKGQSLRPKTQREKDWLSAMELFFKDADKLDQTTRSKLYEKAMEQLHMRYPEDSEAAVFYALALLENVSFSDKTYTSQLKAVAILEKIGARQPNHPGVTHYLIHSYDYQPLATRGLPAANKYAQIAPSAPHAQHMPSHIYSMLGMWEQSIKSNQATLVVGKDYAARNYPEFADASQPHSLDFMEYAYLQLGQDKEAKAVVDEAASMKPVKFARIDTALAAVPARYALERGAWAEAAQLEPRTSNYPYVEAIGQFASAMGLARTGDAARARQHLERLRALNQSLLGLADQAYWARQTEVLVEGASAWIARAEGNDSEGLKLMRAAAALEDSSEKNVAMENRLFPMRELLGYMLLELNQPKQALAEFRASLKSTPNRLRGFYGAGKAAELAGDRTTARSFYEKLVALTKNANGERAELADATAFLAKPKTQTKRRVLKNNF